MAVVVSILTSSEFFMMEINLNLYGDFSPDFIRNSIFQGLIVAVMLSIVLNKEIKLLI
jgi:hypothetical protein